MTLVCKSVGIWDGIVNPIYGCGVKMAPNINPIYAGLETSFLRNTCLINWFLEILESNKYSLSWALSQRQWYVDELLFLIHEYRKIV